MDFCCYNESDTLRTVIIGSSEGYRASEFYVEKVNAVQERLDSPAISALETELNEFGRVLESAGIEVLSPTRVGKIVYDQLTPRDIGVTIGNRFLLCNMAKQSRRYECVGIFNAIFRYDVHEPNILIPPAECLIEGGDVIIDKETIYVGISSRTNRKGFEFIKRHFSDQFEVLSVDLAFSTNQELYLHLDCVFNPVGSRHALIYARGMRKVPELLISNYQLIEISAEEQIELSTNVLSITPDIIISRDHVACSRVNAELRKSYTVKEITFDAIPCTGGSLRCASLPLHRKIKIS